MTGCRGAAESTGVQAAIGMALGDLTLPDETIPLTSTAVTLSFSLYRPWSEVYISLVSPACSNNTWAVSIGQGRLLKAAQFKEVHYGYMQKLRSHIR